MALIKKIGVLCAGSVSTALVSTAISYATSIKTEAEKVIKEAPNNSPWGWAAKGDEEGGDAWWRAQTDKKFK